VASEEGLSSMKLVTWLKHPNKRMGIQDWRENVIYFGVPSNKIM
jgi:hypothetical protein